MNTTRRNFLGGAAAFGGLALTGCVTPPPAHYCRNCRPGRVALQLYSIRGYIKKNGLAKALREVGKAGYEGVEFAGYYDHTPVQLKDLLLDAGLLVCGTHVGTDKYGMDTKKGTYNPDVLAKTCEFELAYGNSHIICPGGGNMPTGVTWAKQRDAKPSQEIDDFTKRLCDLYNKAAKDAAKYGCKIGLHNHQWEFFVKMQDGTTFWDYFFSNTDPAVQMEQDVGWTTCAGHNPVEQYVKYPHRSFTLHAKENGMGKDVKEFDAILGQPGKPGAVPVDWDRLFPVTDADGVKWYVVECERHDDSFDAIVPSFGFLKGKERV